MFGIHAAEQAQEMIDRNKAELLKMVEDGERAENLSRTVNQIAYWEGAKDAFARKEKLDEKQVPLQKQIITLSEILARGANDSWSGRGNDNLRAHFDGVREAISGIILDIEVALD